MVKYNNNHSIIILLIVIFILFVSYYINNKYVIKTEPFDYFNCTMTLDNISPQFVNTYSKFNNQHISCGDCTNATLKMVINPCPIDKNGIPDANCKQKASITSSLGNPIVFTYDITPKNLSNYFCINLDKTVPTSSANK